MHHEQKISEEYIGFLTIGSLIPHYRQLKPYYIDNWGLGGKSAALDVSNRSRLK